MRAALRQDLCFLEWTVAAVGGDEPAAAECARPLPATVPGCVHADLIAAGRIGDPNVAFCELDQQWIGRTDWEYRCRFRAAAGLFEHERIDLVCEGLDTIAQVALNGRPLFGADSAEFGSARVSAANMHHPHRFDVRGALAPGENELCIRFVAPLRHIAQEVERIGARPVNGDWAPYIFLRKEACNLGWDWGPQVATCGVWRPIGLHAWSGARIEAVRPRVAAPTEGSEWGVFVEIDVESAAADNDATAWSARRRICDPDGAPVAVEDANAPPEWVILSPRGGRTTLRLRATVRNPQLWQPRGYGAQPLYRLDVCVQRAGDAAASDAWWGRFGFRTVRLRQTPDAHGRSFAIEVNGRPVFCQGANWIPADLFAGRTDARRVRHLVESAAAANLNMLRVWGGGQYASDEFCDACDELGILVWQDFAFACAMYPEEAPYPRLVQREAEHNVSRLARHPSLALWCGGNECVWAHESWGFGARLAPGQTWGAGYYFDLLPKVCERMDPATPYWPNSPGSFDAAAPPGGEGIGRPPNDPTVGNCHVWDLQMEGYRGVVPRFVSEFGHQSPPNFATLREALPDSELRVGSRAMQHRQRASGGNDVRYDRPIREVFGEIRDFGAWHFAAQLVQARSIALALEWWRAHRPLCGGALFWQWNDVWAGHSWSAIDVAGRRKPLWYAVRRACAPRILTIHARGDDVRLFAVNDADEAWEAGARVARVAFDGRPLAECVQRICVPARGATDVCSLSVLLGRPADVRGELLVAELAAGTDAPAGGAERVARATHFFAPDRELSLPRAEWSARAEALSGATDVTLAAQSLLRDVVLAADRLDPAAEASEQLLTLLPGESATVRVRCAQRIDEAALRGPPIVWAANQLVCGGKA